MADSVAPVFGGQGALRISYTCDTAVLAGRLVQRKVGTRLVEHAGAASLKVCGVASHDVPTTRTTIQGPQIGDGHELTVISGVVIAVSFTGAAVVGDQLISAAAGEVTPAGAIAAAYAELEAEATRAIVGYAFEDVAGAGVGLAFIKHGGSA